REVVAKHLVRPGHILLIFLQVCMLAGCGSAMQKYFGAGHDEPDAASSTVRNADLSARFPANDEPVDRQSGDSPKPLLFPGAEPELLPSAPREPGSGLRMASAEPVAIRGDGVEINFEGADIATVAKVLLGDTLHLNFVVDPKVQGTVTLASVGP